MYHLTYPVLFAHSKSAYSYIFFFSAVNVGLAIDLTIGLIIVLLIIGVSICIGVIVGYKRNCSSLRTRVVATSPATVITSNQTPTGNPSLFTQPQQPVYNDAQFSFQEPPPSYDAVTAAANPTQEIPLVLLI